MVTQKVKKITKVRAKKPAKAPVKPPKKAEPRQTAVEDSAAPAVKFISAVGRRKTARARTRMTEAGQGLFTINGRDLKQYFGSSYLVELVLSPLKATGQEANHDFSIKVVGGGTRSQAEAVRHGLARALVKWNSDFRQTLRAGAYLTRDPREKERKKPGLKKARRAPQWAKR